MDRHLRRARVATSAVATFVVATLVLAACGSSGVRNKGATGSLELPPSSARNEFQDDTVDVPGRVVKVFTAAGVREAIGAVEKAVGSPTRFTEIVLYPEYAVVTVRQRLHPDQLERYLFRAGKVDDMGPEPIGIPRDLDAISFASTDVVWEVVPRLPADSRERIGVGAKSTHVIIARDPVFAQGQLVIRAYATLPTSAGGYVEYDAGGALRRVVN
jgi:hypothetical protein